MSSNLVKTIPLVGVIMLQACATVTTGANQSVSVNTGDVKGAVCKLSNDKGDWYVSSTPGSVTVQRAYVDMNVVCEKENLQGNTTVASSTNAMAFGDIIAGGVLGAAIDVGTGSAYDYPTDITVPLSSSNNLLASDKKLTVDLASEK